MLRTPLLGTLEVKVPVIKKNFSTGHSSNCSKLPILLLRAKVRSSSMLLEPNKGKG